MSNEVIRRASVCSLLDSARLAAISGSIPALHALLLRISPRESRLSPCLDLRHSLEA